MTWELLPVTKTPICQQEPQVTGAFRVQGARKQRVLVLNFNKLMVELLTWKDVTRVLVYHDRDLGKLRLLPVPEDVQNGRALTRTERGHFLLAQPLPDVGDLPMQPAEVLPFLRDRDNNAIAPALIVTLPDWGAPRRVGLTGAQRAADEARRKAGYPPLVAGTRR